MKNATYVDQSDTIRTLTEEELAVVSGGMSPQMFYDLSHGTGVGSGWYNSFAQKPLSAFIPKDPRGVALAFRALHLFPFG